ncbi:OmpA family protein [Reichenbachiella versicolor]|uniref:OmpA family protein n=1 Tax=Reichenbachiella versicolor TaxID=1821036 RepID=UPI000D6E023D|nr:OmpA family protein [Reichenbachiella versicolor]
MKPSLILIILVLAFTSTYAQVCCNVVSGNGNKVVTSNGLCVIAPNLLGDSGCGEAVDSDGDGVPDESDDCPDEAGTKDNDGCPELTSEEKAVLKSALEGVNFVLGKAVLTEDSKPNLHNVTMVLKAHKGFKLKVSGYTDSSGDEQLNLKLSQERADAVKQYLIEDGIEGARIMSKGYGEANPVASNDTEEGRAQNRRVEFEITH